MDGSLKVAICEDTKQDAEKLLEILEKSSIKSRCSVFESGEELLEVFRPKEFDLILSDIYMSGMTGVELVGKIREMDADIPVAFITTSKEHALESYRLSVLKYIEKPYSDKDIENILELALMEKNNAPALIVQKNRKLERIPFSQILYLEQKTHQMNIYLKDGETVQVYDKLSAFLPQLDQAEFFVPHKSYAVNLSFVRYIDTELKCFVMQNNENVPIRRESLSKAKKALEELLFETARSLAP